MGNIFSFCRHSYNRRKIVTDAGKVELMDMYAKNVLSDMKKVTKSSTKNEMYAYIQAWENELETLTYITDYK